MLFQKLQKEKKSPLEILNDKLARGEISDIEYQNKLRLLKISQSILEGNKEEVTREVYKN